MLFRIVTSRKQYENPHVECSLIFKSHARQTSHLGWNVNSIITWLHTFLVLRLSSAQPPLTEGGSELKTEKLGCCWLPVARRISARGSGRKRSEERRPCVVLPRSTDVAARARPNRLPPHLWASVPQSPKTKASSPNKISASKAWARGSATTLQHTRWWGMLRPEQERAYLFNIYV